MNDLLDFLLCVLRKNCLNIVLDDDEYVLHITFLEVGKRCVITLQISEIIEKSKTPTKMLNLIEFVKTEGSLNYFNTKVNFIKAFLDELEEDVSNNGKQ